MTGALGVAAAASGGLQYANAASTHSVKAVAHVFSSATSGEAHGQGNRHATDNRGQAKRDVTDNTEAASASAAESAPAVAASSSAKAGSPQANGNRFRSDAAARRQYVEFVFICLRVPPKHPFVFITLRLPRHAAEKFIARGVATPGPC
jgi:hypothetical protein